MKETVKIEGDEVTYTIEAETEDEQRELKELALAIVTSPVAVEDDDDLTADFDPCPGGCGGITDDPYGGPCTNCWNAIQDGKRRAGQEADRG